MKGNKGYTEVNQLKNRRIESDRVVVFIFVSAKILFQKNELNRIRNVDLILCRNIEIEGLILTTWHAAIYMIR
jgi:hypothetical protein